LGAAETYASILGKKGLAAYRRLAEAEWARVPVLSPGRDGPEKYGKRFRITCIVEALARQTGDVEAVVAVKKRDLSSPYAYLQIAEAYEQAGKHDLALDWAERGLRAFPRRPDPRLHEFLAAQYHRRKRHDEAMALVWAEFAENPTLDQYQNIKSHATRIDQWPVWRDKALSRLREQIERAGRDAEKNRWGPTARPGHSELVRVFLWEKNIEAAWREAKSGGCSGNLWLQLAAKREKITRKTRWWSTSNRSSPRSRAPATRRTGRPSVSCARCATFSPNLAGKRSSGAIWNPYAFGSRRSGIS
jgi:tetratricopeptide (TPR) repeat protein